MNEMLCTTLAFGTNWYSLVGLALDVVGFGVIAYEWTYATRAMRDALNARLSAAHMEDWAIEVDEARRKKEGIPPFSFEEEQRHREITRAILEGRGIATENMIIARRVLIFRIAVGIVIVGLLLQIVGAWPC